MYLFRGRLCGRICRDCPEDLADVTVRLYRLREDQDATRLATAQTKQTFGQLKPAEVKKKQSSLLAEARTDQNGAYCFELDRDDYDGGAFEVDLVFERAPGQEEPAAKPLQFTLTTLQPQWRQTEKGLVWGWDYCLPHRLWCFIRGLLGAWVICGKVEICDTGAPLGGVRVKAFDRDWLQDDALGEAMTDGSGHFRIDYTKADFEPGTFLDVELFGGPDLYFRVETASGVPLLIEPPSRGRDADRENVGPCFCVELCIEEMPDQPQDEPPPVFLRVGGYDYATQIDSAPAGTGLTTGSGRAFYSNNRLNGVLPKKLNGNPMEYQFDTREIQADGTPITAWATVGLAQVARTRIGDLLHYAPAFPGDPNPIKAQAYTVNGDPGEKEAAVVGGWIRVPQESDVFAPQGYFQPNGNMINLISTSLAPDAGVNLAGLVAGNSSTSTGVPLVQNRHFSIRMRVREVGTIGPGIPAGTCQHIAINNTRYDGYVRHPSWMPDVANNELTVNMVDIQQLQVNGCSQIGNDLDVVFTAAHPTLGNVTVWMTGPGGPYSFTEPAAVPGERFGVANPNFVVADLAPCAYVVHLSVQVLLTTGDSIPVNQHDHIAFTKA
ncbi:MAG: transthyretin-like family protein [Acidobacteriota bacterium]|nr:transthyretin-like family protein [Acidobacteriota bacterium]MDH3523111.1 transthyretin-like family protein [Acidobacteriota bacterium]